MTEKKLIRKQIVKNMIMNFITFTIIFSLFASIIYTKIQSSLYKSSDAELLDSGNRKGITKKISSLYEENAQTSSITKLASLSFVRLSSLNTIISRSDVRDIPTDNNDSNKETPNNPSTEAPSLNGDTPMQNNGENIPNNPNTQNNSEGQPNNNGDTPNIKQDNKNIPNTDNKEKTPEKREQPPTNTYIYSDDDDVNPRLTYIVRNSNGEIILENESSEDFQNIGFDDENIDSVNSIKLNNSYSYRYINLVISVDEQDYYVQFFINVDAEEEIVTNLKTTLYIVTASSFFISLIISYFLSKKTLKPIIFAWNKQIEFVQNASHELRTPLTIIQTKEELLLDEPESKIIDNFEDIKITINETKRLSTLVKELMELARVDSNRMKLEKESIVIDDLIKDIVEPFRDIAEAQEKTLHLDLNYKERLSLDKDKIHELLVIIIDNCLKYTSPGDSITVRTMKKDSKKVTITIEDTGIGISDEALPHIFERFYREDKARSRKSGGNGLGLSIAKTIVDAHKGTIKAYHNKPKGTIIEIKLKN